MNGLSPSQIRRRLGEIGDELRALPDDDFSGKNRLNLEADSLRQQLSADPDHDGDAILSGWAERSSRKGAHTPDNDVELAKARIVSPGDSGGAR
ncbi:MAG: hypothetical protein ACI9CV_001094 [Ilumatobacter sp.]|jgi:hypothetical protein